MNSALISTGSFVPVKRELNATLESLLGLPAGWIHQRTGVKSRAVADPHDAVSDLAVRAAKSALSRLDSPPTIDVLILATSTPDHLLPPTSARIANELGLEHAAAFDLTVACSGFLYALILADSLVKTGAGHVMIIAANILSRRCADDDQKTRPIFADGAGAIILGQADKPGILKTAWESDGSKWDSLTIPHGGSRNPIEKSTFTENLHLMQLADGSSIFRYAVEQMANLGRQVIDDSGLAIRDIDWWIPHQANTRIIEATRRILKIDHKNTLLTLAEFGNSSAATIPVTLDYFFDRGQIRPGDRVLMTTAAAGMTSAAAIVEIT